MKIHYLFVVCAAVGLGAALHFQKSPRPSQPVAPATMARAEHKPALELASASQLPQQSAPFTGTRSTAQQRRLTEAPQDPVTEQPSVAANQADVPVDLEEARRQSEALMRGHLSVVAASHGSEARDQRWSNEVGASLQAAFSTEELAGTAVQSIDCRTTTCRIEMQDDGSGDLPAKLPMLAVQMAGSLPNMIAERIDQPDGKMSLVVYLSQP